MIGLLAFQMISPLVIMVPLYRYMDPGSAHRQPGRAVLVYIAISGALFTWMLKGFLDGYSAEPRGCRDDRRLHALGPHFSASS